MLEKHGGTGGHVRHPDILGTKGRLDLESCAREKGFKCGGQDVSTPIASHIVFCPVNKRLLSPLSTSLS